MQFFSEKAPSPLQRLSLEVPEASSINFFVKRDDLLHPQVSGNKWRKLKYNLLEARRLGFGSLLTFGGAYSNHLAATAAAGRWLGFDTVGIVRGEEALAHPSATLVEASHNGMQLIGVSRAAYRDKPQLIGRFGGSHFVIPEGGTNELALQGSAEIYPEIVRQLGYEPDFVVVAYGTGGTSAGILKSIEGTHTRLLVVPVLKITPEKVIQSLVDFHPNASQLTVLPNYHFGGYAKFDDTLLDFIRAFERQYKVPLEQVYTGKTAWAIVDLVRNNHFGNGATVVFVHTGGLQGRHPALGEFPDF